MSKSKKISFLVAATAIGLFAFVNYLNLPRSSHMVTATNVVCAGQIVHYGDSIKRAVADMLQAGIKSDSLDFILPDEPKYTTASLNSVFGQKDILQPPSKALHSEEFVNGYLPLEAFDGQLQYVFTGANKISRIGTDIPEIIFITWPIKKEVCKHINRGLGLGDFWAENHVLSTPPDLTPFHHETGRPITEVNTSGQPNACVQDENGVRYYLHTIVER